MAKTFEEIVEETYASRPLSKLNLEEAATQILGERPKVSYWRTTKGGHKVGFKGSPGSGKPITGHPTVTKQLANKTRKSRDELRKAKGGDVAKKRSAHVANLDQQARHRKKVGKRKKK